VLKYVAQVLFNVHRNRLLQLEPDVGVPFWEDQPDLVQLAWCTVAEVAVKVGLSPTRLDDLIEGPEPKEPE
jgi:hypothetical protein